MTCSCFVSLLDAMIMLHLVTTIHAGAVAVAFDSHAANGNVRITPLHNRALCMRTSHYDTVYIYN